MKTQLEKMKVDRTNYPVKAGQNILYIFGNFNDEGNLVNNHFKIGETSTGCRMCDKINQVHKRITEFKISSSHNPHYVYVEALENAYDVEQMIHTELESKKVNGEIFDLPYNQVMSIVKEFADKYGKKYPANYQLENYPDRTVPKERGSLKIKPVINTTKPTTIEFDKRVPIVELYHKTGSTDLASELAIQILNDYN